MNILDRFIKTDSDFKIGFIALIVGHGIASFLSYGFHHPDEHFQILEWANYFAGNSPDASHLPWEFAAQIRPWFQPILHAFFIKTFQLFGIYEPFSTAVFFRLCYAALNVWTVLALWNHFQKKYALSPKWFLLLGTLWFFPYIHVRTSSENLAGIFTAFALLTLDQVPETHFQKAKGAFFKSGIGLGFAFIARYQIALGIAGVALALLIRDRGLRKTHWAMLGGFLVPVALGVFFDRWGYGNWVFTPYLYYKVNIVQNVAASFNPYPWYQYFIWVLQLIPFISLPILYGSTRFTLKHKLDFFGAFFVSFFVLHWFITNKEYRFLFPILNFVPLMAMAWFQQSKKFRVFTKPGFIYFYLAISLLAFAASSMRGASSKTLGTVHLVHEFVKKNPNAEWWMNQDIVQDGRYRNKYYNIGLTPGFQPEKFHLYSSIEELHSVRSKFADYYIFFDSKVDSKAREMVIYLDTSGCELVSNPVLKWASEHLRFDYQVLYHCTISN